MLISIEISFLPLSLSPTATTAIAVNHKWQWLYSCFHKTCFLRFLQMHNKSISGSLCDAISEIAGETKKRAEGTSIEVVGHFEKRKRHDAPYCKTTQKWTFMSCRCLLCGTNHSVAQVPNGRIEAWIINYLHFQSDAKWKLCCVKAN